MDDDRKERDRRLAELEPEGSYGCCWKRLIPDEPIRCVLPPGHEGPCSGTDAR